jgi:hypothetical protein
MRARWISEHDAARLLGLPTTSIGNLARAGILSVRQLPGARPQVSRDEVEELADGFVRPRRFAPQARSSTPVAVP